MDQSIGNSIEILLEQKPTTVLQAKVSKPLRDAVKKKANELNLDESGFIRLAVVEKLKK